MNNEEEPLNNSHLPTIENRKDNKKSEKYTGIVNAVPMEPFVMNSSTKVHLTLRNISPTPGLRVRFRAEDYLNPSSIDIDIPPGKEKLVSINIVPLGKGNRECMVEFAPLYDAEGNLIPGAAADPIVINEFSYKAREQLAAGLTSSQRQILSTIVKIASMALIVAGIVLVTIPGLQDFITKDFVTSFICVILLLQLPILGLYFFLTNKLPQA
ncbi:MAG: hypothetical protein U9O98_00650 [Asgard group archaeon]|nr:hypothetical protein [Asgard group archaeon]